MIVNAPTHTHTWNTTGHHRLDCDTTDIQIILHFTSCGYNDPDGDTDDKRTINYVEIIIDGSKARLSDKDAKKLFKKYKGEIYNTELDDARDWDDDRNDYY